MDRRFIAEADLDRLVARVQQLKQDGMTVSDIARRMSCHRNTVNGWLRLWKEKHLQGHARA